MEQEELKPCPFCPDGGHVVRLKEDGKPTGMVAHCCYTLGREIRATEEAWNTRHERTCRKVPGKMNYGERRPKGSECGYGLGDSRWDFCPKCGARVERGA